MEITNTKGINLLYKTEIDRTYVLYSENPWFFTENWHIKG